MTVIKIGKKIKQALKDRNLTQEAAADMLKISRQQISNWVNNRNNPPADILAALMKLTGKDANYFFGYPSETGHNHIIGDNNQNINQTVNNLTDIEALKQDVALIKQAILELQRRK